jgi:chromosome partitioning protein
MDSPTIIAIINEKGGTGKTSTAVNLSAALGEQGRKVLLVDLDGQAASSRWLGVEEDNRLAEALYRGRGLEPIRDVLPGVSLAPATGKLDSVAHDLRPTQGGQLRKVLTEMTDFEYVLIDCPPSLGNRLIGNAMLAATHVIVPVETSILALDGLKILLTTLEDVQEGFGHPVILGGVLACRYDGRTRLSHLVLTELNRALPGKVFQTVIRENVRMRECPASGQSILTFAPECHAAADYRALAKEMLECPDRWRLAAPYMDRSDGQAPGQGFHVSELRENAAAAVRLNARKSSPRKGEEDVETDQADNTMEAWLASLAEAERRLGVEQDSGKPPAGKPPVEPPAEAASAPSTSVPTDVAAEAASVPSTTVPTDVAAEAQPASVAASLPATVPVDQPQLEAPVGEQPAAGQAASWQQSADELAPADEDETDQKAPAGASPGAPGADKLPDAEPDAEAASHRPVFFKGSVPLTGTDGSPAPGPLTPGTGPLASPFGSSSVAPMEGQSPAAPPGQPAGEAKTQDDFAILRAYLKKMEEAGTLPPADDTAGQKDEKVPVWRRLFRKHAG